MDKVIPSTINGIVNDHETCTSYYVILISLEDEAIASLYSAFCNKIKVYLVYIVICKRIYLINILHNNIRVDYF